MKTSVIFRRQDCQKTVIFNCIFGKSVVPCKLELEDEHCGDQCKWDDAIFLSYSGYDNCRLGKIRARRFVSQSFASEDERNRRASLKLGLNVMGGVRLSFLSFFFQSMSFAVTAHEPSFRTPV